MGETMSTRCNIIIKDDRDKLIFYRHCDGYPKGALPTLKKFMKWVRNKKIRDNVEQASGWLILIGAKEYAREFDPKTGKYKDIKKDISHPTDNNFDGWQVGAYEPSTSIHGDIEYIYTLDLIKLTIEVYDCYEDKSYIIDMNGERENDGEG
jgi:hypothetical protein